MEFEEYVSKMAERYRIRPLLGMICGRYTGGWSLSPKDEDELTDFKEYFEGELKSSLGSVQGKISIKAWETAMERALSSVIIYEYEFYRNMKTWDTSLRDYLDMLEKLRPDI